MLIPPRRALALGLAALAAACSDEAAPAPSPSALSTALRPRQAPAYYVAQSELYFDTLDTRADPARVPNYSALVARWEWPPWYLLTGYEHDGMIAQTRAALVVEPSTVPTRECRAFAVQPFGRCHVVFRYALNDADGTRTGLLISGVEEFEMGNGDDLVDLTAKLGTGGQSAAAESVTIYGGNGRDALWASGGNDTIEGGNDGDWLSGGTGDDTIYGGNRTGGDTNAVVDVWTVTGVTGQFTDLLDGGAGNDQLFGGSGNDLLSGGSGTDRLTGGDGADRFLFRKPAGAGSWGNDTVTDFNYAAGDRLIAFNWDKTKVTATDTTDGLKIDYLLGNSITLTGVTSTNLDALHLTVNDLFT